MGVASLVPVKREQQRGRVPGSFYFRSITLLCLHKDYVKFTFMTEPQQNPENDTEMADIPSTPASIADTEFFDCEEGPSEPLTETWLFDAPSGNDEKEMAPIVDSNMAPIVDSDMEEHVNVKDDKNGKRHTPRSETPLPDNNLDVCVLKVETPYQHKRPTPRSETPVPDDEMDNCLTPRAGTPDSGVRPPWVEDEDIPDEEETDPGFSLGYGGEPQSQSKRRLQDIIDLVSC